MCGRAPHSRAQHPVAQASFAMAFCRSRAYLGRGGRMGGRVASGRGEGTAGQSTARAPPPHVGAQSATWGECRAVLLGAGGRPRSRTLRDCGAAGWLLRNVLRSSFSRMQSICRFSGIASGERSYDRSPKVVEAVLTPRTEGDKTRALSEESLRKNILTKYILKSFNDLVPLHVDARLDSSAARGCTSTARPHVREARFGAQPSARPLPAPRRTAAAGTAPATTRRATARGRRAHRHRPHHPRLDCSRALAAA